VSGAVLANASRVDDFRTRWEDGLMQGPMRGILAGIGAWKLGGGCFSTIIIFIILYWALGYAHC
jgi:hypothetical protein